MWKEQAVIDWTAFMLISYKRWTGQDLIWRRSRQFDAQTLYQDRRVVVSHGLGDDPIFNYANAAAQSLWGMDWQQFIFTPSRLSAPPVDRDERAAALQRTTDLGFVANYAGIRVTADGRRFQIQDAVVWNVFRDQTVFVGQAAMIPRWNFL